jgi:hypothetical protein
VDRDTLARKKPNKVKFSDAFVRNLCAGEKPYIIWDTHQKGFCIRVQPSGSRVYKLSYNLCNRTRWFTIGGADAIALSDARRIAAELMLQVIRGGDPQAERRAKRGTGTFSELAERYLEEHAKRKNKSWPQGAALIAKHLTPKWAKLAANSITRSDVKAALSRITNDSVAKQTLAAVSAVFSWAVKEEIAGVTANPCTGITYEKARSRERILSNSEVKMFWDAFDCAGLIAGSALKVILLGPNNGWAPPHGTCPAVHRGDCRGTSSLQSRASWYEAEVDRIAGEIALRSPEPDAAKAQDYFERALAVARQQQAKSWELRAAMSLARLWREQGKRNEARDLLAPVYDWITEGFDTRDLKQARRLRDELAP